jgi:hypothetical protein
VKRAGITLEKDCPRLRAITPTLRIVETALGACLCCFAHVRAKREDNADGETHARELEDPSFCPGHARVAPLWIDCIMPAFGASNSDHLRSLDSATIQMQSDDIDGELRALTRGDSSKESF